MTASLVVFLTVFGSQTLASEDRITLNFEKADLRSVVATVSEHTGHNFIVDPRVRGELTIISETPVDSEQLYQVFLSALQIHGFAVVPADGAKRIVPRSLAKRDQTVMLDEDGPATLEGYDFVTQVLRIDHVQASELVPVLRPLLSDDGHLAAHSTSNNMILSDAAGIVGRVRTIIGRLDRDTSGVTDVVPLKHASANEIVRLVESVEEEERGGRRLLLVADERTNSILVGGDPQRRPAVRSLIQRLDAELEEDDGAAVVYLRYADAEEMVGILQGLAEKFEGEGGRDDSISIHAHQSTNSLIISGMPDVVSSLRSVVNRLDVRRAQVHVEAIIAEVSDSRMRQLGVQWGAFGESGVGLINFNMAGGGSLANIAGAAATGTVPGNIGSGALVAGANARGDMGALLGALADDSGTNILSTPSVMTMDNEEAEIMVGQNVPFVTGRAIEDSGQAFSSIQRQDVGVQLRIKPQINEGDAIKLLIEKEVSSVIEEGVQNAQDLVTTMRSIKTTAMVDDGQTIVLGGLMDEQTSTTTQGVPGLSRIPWLGWLFRYERSTAEKRNLMVFLQPRIIKTRDDARVVTSPKYQLMRAEQLANRERGLRFLDDDLIPILAESADLMRLPPAFDDRVGAPSGRQAADMMAPPRGREQ